MLIKSGLDKETITAVVVDAARLFPLLRLSDLHSGRENKLRCSLIKRLSARCTSDELVIMNKDEQSSADVQVQQ